MDGRAAERFRGRSVAASEVSVEDKGDGELLTFCECVDVSDPVFDVFGEEDIKEDEIGGEFRVEEDGRATREGSRDIDGVMFVGFGSDDKRGKALGCVQAFWDGANPEDVIEAPSAPARDFLVGVRSDKE